MQALIAVLSLLALASVLKCAGSPPTVTQGHERLGVVRFPERFVRTGSGGGKVVITDIGYEVRKLTDANGARLLFGMKSFDMETRSSVYSDNFYAVSLDGQFKVTPITARDWDRAERASTPRPGQQRDAGSQTEDEIEYRGKNFKRTGRSWGLPASLPSPQGKWLAVFSHTSAGEPRPGPVTGGRGYGKGEMFVDVYDTSTGEKVIAGRAPHSGGGYPQVLFENALWIEDRYLVVPLDTPRTLGTEGDACFLGILPE